MVRPLAIATMALLPSSWASAFKKLLEAFKLTVTSNRAFVLFLGQLSVVGSTIKLAIRKI